MNVTEAHKQKNPPRVQVPIGQTPLDDNLGHKYLDVFNQGMEARESGSRSPYHGCSLEHCLHAAGWVQRDLRIALDQVKAAPNSAEQEAPKHPPELVKALQEAQKMAHLISIVDQGCGGNLNPMEMAQSAMRQALNLSNSLKAFLAELDALQPDPLVEAIDELVDLLAPTLTHSQGMAATGRNDRFRAAIRTIAKGE